MSTPLRRRRSILTTCLGAALALSACKGPKDDGVVAPDGGGAGQATGAGAVELAPVDHPSQLLPRGTAMLVTGTSIARAAEVLERDHLVQAFGPQYTSLRAMIVGSVGYDLLDPKAWPEVGLDPGGTVGLAVSDLTDPRLVLLATVADRTKLVELVRRVAGKGEVEIVEEPYGSASVLRPKGESQDPVVVLRDRFAAMVIAPSGKGGTELAKLMVTMDPNVSLASDAGYRKATGGLRAADLVAYLDVAGMVDQTHARTEVQAPSNDWAQEELARAREEGAPPERLAELERRVEQAREDAEYWRSRHEGERALVELLVSGIEGVGITATVKRGGPVLDGRVVAGPDAFLRRLLANREGAPALPVAMNGAPIWCGSGRIDPATGHELAQAIAVAEGRGAGAAAADIKQVLGLDLEAELLPALAGDLELCFAIDGTLEEGVLDPEEHLGIGAIVRTTDAAKAKYLLAKLATAGGKLGARMKKRGDGYAIDLPDWRTVHVQPVGERVVVSTDAGLAKRLAAGDPGSMPSKIRPPAAAGAMSLSGTAATQAFDLSLGMLSLALGRSTMIEPVVVAAGLTLEEMEKVPLSAKSKKAKQAMQKARTQVEAIEAKREIAETKELLAVTDGLGILVTAATEDDRGFLLTGGQFLRAEGLGHAIATLLQAALTGRGPTLEPAEQKALDEAWQRWSEAQRAYVEARQQDGEKFLKKRGGSKTQAEPAPSR